MTCIKICRNISCKSFRPCRDAETRDIAQDFDNYVLNLTLMPRLVFGNRQLEVHLYPRESDHMATGCISQFEDPPDSANFTDVAFVVRPNADMRAPSCMETH